MVNPTLQDPFYTGPDYRGYYMQTDIGYLRFIFYSGLLGLCAIFFFIWKVGRICMRKFKKQEILFWLLLIVNYTVWLKVSTDIFLVLALFLVISKEENEEFEERIKLSE